MENYVLRFVIGGLAVSVFAAIGDMLRPKSFAGLFGAAPSIALSTLAITLSQKGPAYVGVEGRSMLIGAMALWLYSLVVCHVLMRHRWQVLLTSSLALIVWLAAALGGERIFFG